MSLLFPIALGTAQSLGIDCMPFVAAVTVAGSPQALLPRSAIKLGLPRTGGHLRCGRVPT